MIEPDLVPWNPLHASPSEESYPPLKHNIPKLGENHKAVTSVTTKSSQYLDNGISVIATLETNPSITRIALQQAAASLGSSSCSRCRYASQTCHALSSDKTFNSPFPLCRKPRGFPKSHDKLEHFHSKKGTAFFPLGNFCTFFSSLLFQWECTFSASLPSHLSPTQESLMFQTGSKLM